MQQFETDRANHFFLRVTQHSKNGRARVPDAAIGIPDGENVVIVLDHHPEMVFAHSITGHVFFVCHRFPFSKRISRAEV